MNKPVRGWVAHLSTNTPCPLATVPSGNSMSFTLDGPMSHWQVMAVTQALSLFEKTGSGFENMT